VIIMMRPLMWVGLGAGLMYFLDPDRGRSRRARARDRIIHLLHEAEHEAEIASRDLANRTRGLVAKSRSLAGADGAPDGVITARVRSKLGHLVSHPHAIEVTVRNQRVRLSGPVLAEEVPRLIRSVKSVHGVHGVEDRLQVFERPGDHPALQGGRPRRPRRLELRPQTWTPAQRLLAGTALGVAALRLTGRGGLAGLALGALGVGLIAARPAGNRSERPRQPRRAARPAIATGGPVGDVVIPIHPPRHQVPELGL
jgi:hypothetical protein